MSKFISFFGKHQRISRVLLPFLICSLQMSACTTAFPPASFDWGHGAKPLEAKQGRAQTGGGMGVVPPLQVLFADQVKKEDFIPLGIGAGGGAAVEYQVNESLLLRGDAALGAEWSIVSSIPSPILAGYVGAQFNILPSLAARARLGVGGQLHGFVLPSGYVAGETGLVWSFLSTEEWEGWVYGYGMGRAGTGYLPTLTSSGTFGFPSAEFERRFFRNLGVGNSVGLSKKVSGTFSWYISGRADMPVLLLDADLVGSSGEMVPVPLPVVGGQAGVTWVF